MSEWLQNTYVIAMMWTLGALLLLLIVLLLIKIVRNLTFGTFVSGGRNRKARLAVMDAAAVDSHRRLVLVRRDDVEHLILIGGSSDIVVEQNIRLAPALRRPEETPRDNGEERSRSPAQPQPAPQRPQEAVAAPVQPAPAEPAAQRPSPAPAPVSRPAAPQAPAVPAPPPPRPMAQPVAASPVQPPRQPVTPLARPPAPAVAAAASPAVRPAPPAPSAPVEPSIDLDEALREELEVTLDERKHRAEDDLPASVEDEMSKLLGELSRTKR